MKRSKLTVGMIHLKSSAVTEKLGLEEKPSGNGRVSCNYQFYINGTIFYSPTDCINY